MARRSKDSAVPGSHQRDLLGERLRLLRIRRRLTLADVALGSGLSRSFIALVEAGTTDISVSRLVRLAEFYGVWISDVVGSIGPAVEILHPEDVRAMPSDDAGVELHVLTNQSVRGLLPFRVRLQPGCTLDGGVAHSGEEFIHCVAGAIELRVVDTAHQLKVGDTASFPGRLPHSYMNSGDEEAIVIGASVRD